MKSVNDIVRIVCVGHGDVVSMTQAIGIMASLYEYAIFALVISLILLNEMSGGSSLVSVYIGISFLIFWFVLIPLMFLILKKVITNIPKLDP